MVSLYNSNSCCGVDEVCGIEQYENDSHGALNSIAESYFNEPDYAAILMFNGVANEGYVEELAELIKSLKIGRVIGTLPKINQNSGNKIRCYLWSVNQPAFKKWATAQGIDTHKHEDNYDNW